jgi:molybdenum transport protein
MVYLADETLEKFIKEDVPYLDLTTWILGIGEQHGAIRFFNREKTVLCGTEEAARIARKFDLEVKAFLPSGTQLESETMVLEAAGRAADLHRVWKVTVNILEHASGIATRTRDWLERIHAVDPTVGLVTTRKGFPGTKELATKAVLAGGGYPHRLGLSETVLIFPQHRAFLAARNRPLTQVVTELKEKACEKKILAEAESLTEALEWVAAGVDGIQFDKIAAAKLREYVSELRRAEPRLVILAAGGIHQQNIAEYAATGVNALVTSAVYFGKPSDFSARMVVE